MRRLILVLLISVVSFAQDKYPLTIEVISSDTKTSTRTSGDTTCDSYNEQTVNCSSKTIHQSDITQTAKGSDGNMYVLMYEPQGWAAVAQGAANSSGNVQNGAMVPLGSYKARLQGRYMIVLHQDKKGKPKEAKFSILSVRKDKDSGQKAVSQ